MKCCDLNFKEEVKILVVLVTFIIGPFCDPNKLFL